MSPNQLIPSQPYTLAYYITDHTDAGTYYVQAKVYDAATGELLDTQNLTRQTTNTRLFSKVAQAPGDSSGHGRRIIVVATAYTDAGYTSKSSTYAEQSENYIVIKAGGGLLGGGGGFIDHNGLYEMFKHELALNAKEVTKALNGIEKMFERVYKVLEKLPTDKSISTILAPLAKVLVQVDEAIKKLPTETVNLDATHALIEKTLDAIGELHNKEVDIDLSSIHDHLTTLRNHIDDRHKEGDTILGQHISDLHTALPGYISGKQIEEEPQDEEIEPEEEDVEAPEPDLEKLM